MIPEREQRVIQQRLAEGLTGRVRIDNSTDWKLVAELVDESYRMTAPKRLAATIGAK
jgi:hypothetical protein